MSIVHCGNCNHSGSVRLGMRWHPEKGCWYCDECYSKPLIPAVSLPVGPEVGDLGLERALDERERAIEAATKYIYEDKGNRKGVRYVGWEAEPEDVKERWREDVRVTISAYEYALAYPIERYRHPAK